MAKINKLLEIYSKAEYALAATNRARKEISHPGSLWYHAIGMFNAFYAINEELKIRTKNGNDKALTAAVDAWLQTNADTIKAFFGNARNVATHQGEITVEPCVEWEWDIANDTEHPIARATFTVKGSSINRMPAIGFIDQCEDAITFMREGILSIDREYKSQGGVEHALPDDKFAELF